MNLFFTSAGRRDYFIDYFANALGGTGEIHVGNSDPLCSAFTLPVQRVVTPEISGPGYLSFLVDYCRKHRIDALIPLFDLDLPVLARARRDFAAVGTRVVVADPETIEICNDKWRTLDFLTAAGFRVPRTWRTVDDALAALERGDVQYPLVVKPRWGMGSLAMVEAHDRLELGAAWAMARRRIFESYLRFESAADPDHCVLIQERLRGLEYGLDILNDLEGRHAATSVKHKLAMRAGEADAAITVEIPMLGELGRQLAAAVRHPGSLDVDLFVVGGVPVIVELNCRFGGGYPFTHLAGADFPAAMVAWLRSETPRPEWLRPRAGVTAIKALQPKQLVLP